MFGKADESILKYVNDYKLNLIVPAEIEDFSRFTSEFGKAMKYIAVSKDEKEYQKTTEDEYYGTVSVETARLLNECAGTKICIDEKEEVVSMCKAWDDHEARGKEIGDARTLVNIVSNVQENMSCSLEQALVTVGKTLEEYEKARKLLKDICEGTE